MKGMWVRLVAVADERFEVGGMKRLEGLSLGVC